MYEEIAANLTEDVDEATEEVRMRPLFNVYNQCLFTSGNETSQYIV